jgi:hypothetical protein
MCVIKLPDNEQNGRGTIDNSMTHTRIAVTEKDSCNDSIRICMSKCKYLTSDEYIFKGHGINDFMWGENCKNKHIHIFDMIIVIYIYFFDFVYIFF